eukprot:1013544-Amorphochlora_amoeboformis.AAC.1
MAGHTPLQNSPRVFLGLLLGFLLGGSGLGLGLVAGKRVVTGKVHVLDKDTFEHDTQASTGEMGANAGEGMYPGVLSPERGINQEGLARATTGD